MLIFHIGQTQTLIFVQSIYISKHNNMFITFVFVVSTYETAYQKEEN